MTPKITAARNTNEAPAMTAVTVLVICIRPSHIYYLSYRLKREWPDDASESSGWLLRVSGATQFATIVRPNKLLDGIIRRRRPTLECVAWKQRRRSAKFR